MKNRILLVAAFAALLSGCTTTEEVNTAIQSRWTGQPADAFFTRYGPPVSSFALNNGGTVYTWRGGEKTNYIPAQYAQPSDDDAVAKSVTRTTTRRDANDDETTITTTKTAIGITDNRPRLISEASVQELFCEVQISTTPDDRIISIRASNDTTGEGLSLSRCAEVLEVQK